LTTSPPAPTGAGEAFTFNRRATGKESFMGRSVATAGDASATAYLDVSHISCPEEWDDLLESLRIDAERLLKLPTANRWGGREIHIIAEDPEKGAVVISEYCGLAAVSIVARWNTAKGRRFRDSAAKHLQRLVKNYLTLRRIGTASNGESFYQPA
jgi:hypothetical protein